MPYSHATKQHIYVKLTIQVSIQNLVGICIPFPEIKYFSFLAQLVTSLPTEDGKGIYTTYGSNILSFVVDSDLGRCSHGEAATRWFLHAADAVQKGFRKI